MVIGAVLVGYASCMLQQGFGPSFLSRKEEASETEFQEQPTMEKLTPIIETIKEEPVAGWPSFGQLIIDLSKLALEALANIFLYFLPSRFTPSHKKGLTPLKDSLIMPEDEAVTVIPSIQKQRAPAPISETRDVKPPKLKSNSFKDPSLSSKQHRSSKRQEFAEFYGSGEVPPAYSQSRSKSMKERTRHRQRDVEVKPVEAKPVEFEDPKFNHYNMRNKYGSDDSFRF